MLKKVVWIASAVLFSSLFIGMATLFTILSGLPTAVREWCRPAYTAAPATIETVDAEIPAVLEGRRRVTPYYLPRITYAFDADGHRYTGDTVGPHARDLITLRHSNKDGVNKNFKVGQSFTVMYNPADPTRSYIIVPGQAANPGAFFNMAIVTFIDIVAAVVPIRIARGTMQSLRGDPPATI